MSPALDTAHSGVGFDVLMSPALDTAHSGVGFDFSKLFQIPSLISV